MMWIVWIPIVILIIIMVVRLTGHNDFFGYQGKRENQESPLEILRRRYAKGEISTEEYQETIKKLR